MLVTSSESPDDVTGTLTVKSFANLTKLFVCGCLASMSLTINENKKGPRTEYKNPEYKNGGSCVKCSFDHVCLYEEELRTSEIIGQV